MHRAKKRHGSLTRLAAVLASLGVSMVGYTVLSDPAQAASSKGCTGGGFTALGHGPGFDGNAPVFATSVPFTAGGLRDASVPSTVGGRRGLVNGLQPASSSGLGVQPTVTGWQLASSPSLGLQPGVTGWQPASSPCFGVQPGVTG